MKISFWYVIVIVDVLLLISSFIYHNLYLTILTFIIALALNKFQKIIFIPKQSQSSNIIYSDKRIKNLSKK